MDKLQEIENKHHILLPKVYIDFYNRCSFSISEKLIGTDLRNTNSELNEWAIELLKENGITNFLKQNDFVFIMHQGYVFWYFNADGNDDPFVYGYYEGKTEPDNLGHFSDFIRNYIQ